MNALQKMVSKFSPLCIFLMETKANRQRIEWIRRKLGYDYCEVIEACGWAGGLVMLWKTEINLKQIWQTERTFGFEVRNVEREGI